MSFICVVFLLIWVCFVLTVTFFFNFVLSCCLMLCSTLIMSCILFCFVFGCVLFCLFVWGFISFCLFFPCHILCFGYIFLCFGFVFVIADPPQVKIVHSVIVPQEGQYFKLECMSKGNPLWVPLSFNHLREHCLSMVCLMKLNLQNPHVSGWPLSACTEQKAIILNQIVVFGRYLVSHIIV